MDNKLTDKSPYLCKQNKTNHYMNKGLLLAMAFAMSISAHALSLKGCLQMARDNYPAIKQYKMIELSRDFTLENVAKGWLPQVSASAGAYGFTDILKANEQMQKMGVDMKNYMANASVMVRQNVYDGGQMNAQKQVARMQSKVQQTQLDVSVYAIYDRVDQLYFGILLLDEQLKQNRLLHNDLSNSEKNIRSMIKGGIANQTDLDAILVEELKADQQQESLLASRKAYLRMLGVFVGKELSEAEKLEKPSTIAPQHFTGKDMYSTASGAITSNGKWSVNRPELSYYESQNQLLAAQRKQLDARLRPTVSLIGMGMVHSKLSDMVHNGLLMGGVSLSWNIGALYTRKNDIKKLDLQEQMNQVQRETFLFNNRLQNEEVEGNMDALRKQIAKDDEIVRLRESIRSKSDKKVQLGTESVNELVRDINAVSLARAQKAQHEIQLLEEMYKQLTINNN